jgi:hypothetical protein
MKQILPSLLFLLFSSVIVISSEAQTVSITANASTTQLNGLGHQNYHVSEYVYTETEIGVTNFLNAGSAINKINLNATVVGTPNFFDNVKIYLKNIPSTTTTLTPGNYNTTGYTEVFSGTFTASAPGWVGVNLNTPFVRTAGSNLQMMIERTDNVDHSTAAALFTWATANGNNLISSAATSRRHNGIAALSGATALATSSFRVAVQFISTAANDAALTAFTSLPSPSCFNTNQTISVTLNNAGSSAMAASAAPVTLAVTGANTFSSTVSNTSSIASGGSTTITFTGVNLNNPGTNNITVYSSLPGDASTLNDTLKTTITTTAITTSFPVITGAETSTLIFEHLKILNGTRTHWGLNSSLTASATGAYKNVDLTDSLYPKAGTKYYIFDSYSGASSLGNRVVLFAGCFALPPTNGTNVYDMKFWMSQDNSYPTDLDSIYAVVSVDKGVTWTRLLPGFGRVNASFPTPGWIQRAVDITAYAGQTIQLGIEGVSAYGNIIGIDDIAVRANNPLPVTFTSFSGLKDGVKNILQWSTTTEINNAFFSLERSLDGTNFSELTIINSKALNGNSNAVLNYDFTDVKPIVGKNYYRLKQVDKDGKFSYSQIVLLKGSKLNGVSVSAVYPNPAKDNVSIVFNAELATRVNIAIVDVAGKIVQQKQATLNNGQTSYISDISTLRAGNYIIKVTDLSGAIINIQKLNKQ